MQNKTFYLLEKDFVEYIIEVTNRPDNKVFVLKRSVSKMWAEDAKAKTILTVYGNSNGYKFKWEEKQGNKLDFATTVELTLMLNFLNTYDNDMPTSYSIVEATNLTKLL